MISNDNKILNQKIYLLPDVPGSYQMKDKNGDIIYVGKAKSLLKRVKQYFTRPQRGKVMRMVLEIADFDIIETHSEKEALLLEISLIHKYHPKYNIMLMDDKMYPYIALKKDKYPFLKISHSNKEKGYYYFGPFPNSNSAYKIIDLLNKIYPIRKCRNIPLRACLYYHMGQCLAPCINDIKEEDYKETVESIISFLKGESSKIRSNLVLKMKQYSSSLEFEKANDIKLLINDIDNITDNQKIIFDDKVDRDIIAYSIRDGYICIVFLLYRNGVLLGKKSYVEELENDIDEVVENLIVQFYQKNDVPNEIIIPSSNIASLIEDTLNVKTIFPERGKKKDLLTLAITNSKQMLDEHFQTAQLEDDVLLLLEELKEKLNMKKTPLDIELYDNSHTDGYECVSAMVKFINGQKSKQNYRKYKIRQENKQDDLASMREVLTRRFSRLKEENAKFPDLIIVDGGFNQCTVALEVKKEMNVDVFIAGLEKNDKHETDSLINAETGELIHLKKGTPLFFFLMRMQDEVHRYAITYHISKRNKSNYKTIYDDINNIGEKRKLKLLELYPTIDSLSSVTINELKQIIPEDAAIEVIKRRDEYFLNKDERLKRGFR